MPEHVTVRSNAKTGARFIRNYTGVENLAPGPDSYVDLQYEQHTNSDYVRISARNLHPQKAIRAYFYALPEDGGRFAPAGMAGRTIKACLKPAETAVIHFEEKRHNLRLFLFNAAFAEGD
jgi:hypothetical protein